MDVVLEGSGIDEKFLGVTLFALVPNTTEFMNAISFALNGNIALRYVSCPRCIEYELTRVLAVWKSGLHTRSKCVCCRFPRWSRSRRGTRQSGWAPSRRPSRAPLLLLYIAMTDNETTHPG